MNYSKLFVSVTESEQIVAENPIISDDLGKWIDSVLVYLMFVFGALGVVTNTVNVRVFAQQGLSDSNTIGLFALAITDLLGCFTLIPYAVCDVMKYTAPTGDVISCKTITILVCTVPHIILSRITCWITVYIAIERCLCVLIPFKVRSLLRPRVASLVMTSIFLVFVVVNVPWFANLGLKWRFSTDFNTTVGYMTENTTSKLMGRYLSIVMSTVLTPVAAILVTLTTGLMLYKLNKYSKWRQQTATSGSKKPVKRGDNSDLNQLDADKVQGQAKRDVEVLKMVVMVIGLFLVCLVMSLLPGVASSYVEGFSFTGVNRNLFNILYLYKYVFDGVNSSLNFFFYVRISSRYKAAFGEVFRKQSVTT